MANVCTLFLPRARVPERSALQRSIEALGFALELAPTERPFEAEGFLPCRLMNEKAGFEVSSQPAVDVIAANPQLSAIAGDGDHCIDLVWRGEELDWVCVLIVCGALMRDCGATCAFNGEPSGSADEVLAEARAVLEEISAERKRKNRLKPRSAVTILRKAVGSLLEPKGFSCEGSREVVFYRQVTDDLFHFIDLQIDRTEYYVRAYPSSPRLSADAWSDFPDGVPCPLPEFAYLNAKAGMGHHQSRFPLKDGATTEKIAASVLLPALEKFALPYIDRFCTIDDLVAVLDPRWKLVPNSR